MVVMGTKSRLLLKQKKTMSSDSCGCGVLVKQQAGTFQDRRQKQPKYQRASGERERAAVQGTTTVFIWLLFHCTITIMTWQKN